MNIDNLSDKQIKNLKIQFLFVTANKYEQAELMQRLTPIEPETVTTYTSETLSYTIGYLGSYLIAHVHCPQQGTQGPYGAMLSIKEAYQAINPLCVIMVGIAYGRSSEMQALGDVLLSQQIKPYNSVRRSTGKYEELITEDRNKPMSPGFTIMNLAKDCAQRINNISLRYRVQIGTILAGEELIDNKEYKEELFSAFTSPELDIIGGEMEAVGLASVMIHAENMNWIVVKAICDWADGKKRDRKSELQQLAAQNAVDFCVRFLNTDNPSKLPNFL